MVDKTLFIDHVINAEDFALLILRPRRFGKTLNMSMLKYFLTEKNTDDKLCLFTGLLINKDVSKNAWLHQGKYCVISITFQGVKSKNYIQALLTIKTSLAMLCQDYKNEIDSSSKKIEKKYLLDLIEQANTIIENQIILEINLKQTLYYLILILSEYRNSTLTNKPTIYLLVDEYDTPIHESYFSDTPYYEKIVSFMKELFAFLKSNEITSHLTRVVFTGIQRISKEGIFSDSMNNITPLSVIEDNFFHEDFGFTKKELASLLEVYGIQKNRVEAISTQFEDWYGNYHISNNTVVYNPWSIVKALSNLKIEQPLNSEQYWVGATGDAILKQVLTTLKETAKEQFESFYQNFKLLSQGEVIESIIDIHTAFAEIGASEKNFLSFLLLSGYLTCVGRQENNRYLKAPNEELRIFYRNNFEEWFKYIDTNELPRCKNYLKFGGKNPSIEEISIRIDGTRELIIKNWGKDDDEIYQLLLNNLLINDETLLLLSWEAIEKFEKSYLPQTIEQLVHNLKQRIKKIREFALNKLISLKQHQAQEVYEVQLKNLGQGKEFQVHNLNQDEELQDFAVLYFESDIGLLYFQNYIKWLRQQIELEPITNSILLFFSLKRLEFLTNQNRGLTPGEMQNYYSFLLTHLNADVREHALDKLAVVIKQLDESIITRLYELLEHSEAGICVIAIKGLGLISLKDNPSTFDKLMNKLIAEEVRLEVQKALSKVFTLTHLSIEQNDRVTRRYFSMLDSSNPEIRDFVLSILTQNKDNTAEVVTNLLITLKKSTEKSVQQQAIVRLIRVGRYIPGKQVDPLFISLRQSILPVFFKKTERGEDEDIQTNALEGIGELIDEENRKTYIPRCISFITSNYSPNFTRASIILIKKLKEKGHVKTENDWYSQIQDALLMLPLLSSFSQELLVVLADYNCINKKFIERVKEAIELKEPSPILYKSTSSEENDADDELFAPIGAAVKLKKDPVAEKEQQVAEHTQLRALLILTLSQLAPQLEPMEIDTILDNVLKIIKDSTELALIRRNSVETLGQFLLQQPKKERLSKAMREGWKQLSVLLHDNDSQVREATYRIIQASSFKNTNLIINPQLLGLKHTNADICEHAIQWVSNLFSSEDKIIKDFITSEKELPKIIDVLLSLLGRPQETVRVEAQKLLGMLSAKFNQNFLFIPTALNWHVQHLEKGEEHVKLGTMSLLAELENPTLAIKNAIQRQLTNTHRQISQRAIALLEKWGVLKELGLDAIRTGNHEQFQLLLDSSFFITHLTSEGGTILHEIVRADQQDMIELILKKEPTFLDRPDSRGTTPFLLAVSKGHTVISKTLVEAGASLTAVNQDGQNAFLLAVENDYKNMAEWILSLEPNLLRSFDKEGRNALHTAVRANNEELLLWGLSIGIEPTQTAQGETLLHVAVQYASSGQLLCCSLIKFLLSHYPSMGNQKSNLGETALAIAKKKGDLELVNLLSSREEIVYCIDSLAAIEEAIQEDWHFVLIQSEDENVVETFFNKVETLSALRRLTIKVSLFFAAKYSTILLELCKKGLTSLAIQAETIQDADTLLETLNAYSNLEILQLKSSSPYLNNKWQEKAEVIIALNKELKEFLATKLSYHQRELATVTSILMAHYQQADKLTDSSLLYLMTLSDTIVRWKHFKAYNPDLNESIAFAKLYDTAAAMAPRWEVVSLVKHNQIDILRRLHQLEALNLHLPYTDSKGKEQRLVCAAIAHNNVEIVEWLIKNAVDMTGWPVQPFSYNKPLINVTFTIAVENFPFFRAKEKSMALKNLFIHHPAAVYDALAWCLYTQNLTLYEEIIREIPFKIDYNWLVPEGTFSQFTLLQLIIYYRRSECLPDVLKDMSSQARIDVLNEEYPQKPHFHYAGGWSVLAGLVHAGYQIGLEVFLNGIEPGAISFSMHNSRKMSPLQLLLTGIIERRFTRAKEKEVKSNHIYKMLMKTLQTYGIIAQTIEEEFIFDNENQIAIPVLHFLIAHHLYNILTREQQQNLSPAHYQKKVWMPTIKATVTPLALTLFLCLNNPISSATEEQAVVKLYDQYTKLGLLEIANEKFSNTTEGLDWGWLETIPHTTFLITYPPLLELWCNIELERRGIKKDGFFSLGSIYQALLAFSARRYLQTQKELTPDAVAPVEEFEILMACKDELLQLAEMAAGARKAIADFSVKSLNNFEEESQKINYSRVSHLSGFGLFSKDFPSHEETEYSSLFMYVGLREFLWAIHCLRLEEKLSDASSIVPQKKNTSLIKFLLDSLKNEVSTVYQIFCLKAELTNIASQNIIISFKIIDSKKDISKCIREQWSYIKISDEDSDVIDFFFSSTNKMAPIESIQLDIQHKPLMHYKDGLYNLIKQGLKSLIINNLIDIEAVSYSSPSHTWRIFLHNINFYSRLEIFSLNFKSNKFITVNDQLICKRNCEEVIERNKEMTDFLENNFKLHKKRVQQLSIFMLETLNQSEEKKSVEKAPFDQKINQFNRFIDNHIHLMSEQVIRYMFDIGQQVSKLDRFQKFNKSLKDDFYFCCLLELARQWDILYIAENDELLKLERIYAFGLLANLSEVYDTPIVMVSNYFSDKPSFIKRQTLLSAATQASATKIVEWLIDKGVDTTCIPEKNINYEEQDRYNLSYERMIRPFFIFFKNQSRISEKIKALFLKNEVMVYDALAWCIYENSLNDYEKIISTASFNVNVNLPILSGCFEGFTLLQLIFLFKHELSEQIIEILEQFCIQEKAAFLNSYYPIKEQFFYSKWSVFACLIHQGQKEKLEELVGEGIAGQLNLKNSLGYTSVVSLLLGGAKKYCLSWEDNYEKLIQYKKLFFYLQKIQLIENDLNNTNIFDETNASHPNLPILHYIFLHGLSIILDNQIINFTMMKFQQKISIDSLSNSFLNPLQIAIIHICQRQSSVDKEWEITETVFDFYQQHQLLDETICVPLIGFENENLFHFIVDKRWIGSTRSFLKKILCWIDCPVNEPFSSSHTEYPGWLPIHVIILDAFIHGSDLLDMLFKLRTDIDLTVPFPSQGKPHYLASYYPISALFYSDRANPDKTSLAPIRVLSDRTMFLINYLLSKVDIEDNLKSDILTQALYYAVYYYKTSQYNHSEQIKLLLSTNMVFGHMEKTDNSILKKAIEKGIDNLFDGYKNNTYDNKTVLSSSASTQLKGKHMDTEKLGKPSSQTPVTPSTKLSTDTGALMAIPNSNLTEPSARLSDWLLFELDKVSTTNSIVTATTGTPLSNERLPITRMQDVITLLQQPMTPDRTPVLGQLFSQITHFFIERPNPSVLWVAEIIALASSITDSDLLQRLLNTYLTNMQRTPVLAASTIKGFADLLVVAYGSAWLDLDRAKLDDIFALLQKQRLLFNIDLSLDELYDTVALWRALLLAMDVHRVDLSGYKEKIATCLKAIKQRFKLANENQGVWQTRLAQQALYRLKDNQGEPSNAVKAALCLGSAGIYLAEAAVGASGTATYGVGALTAIGPLINATKDIGIAGILAVRAIKAAKMKDKTYPSVRDLQAALLAAAFANDKGKTFIDLIVEIQTFKQPQLALLCYALIDTFTQVAISLPGEEYVLLHRAIYNTLKQWFNEADSPDLQAHIVQTYYKIGTQAKIGDFAVFIPQLIKRRSTDYIQLPFVTSHIPGLIELYLSCEQRVSAGNASEDKLMIQDAIISRLEVQFSAHPDSVAQVLAQLECYPGLDLSLVQSTQGKLHREHGKVYGEAISRARAEAKKALSPQMPSSLALAVWYGLNPALQSALEQLCQQAGLSAAPIEKALPQEALYLFGHVSKMVIGNLIDRGAVQINYPAQIKTVKGLAEFVREVNKDIRATADDITPLASNYGLAARVDFGFVGNYVKGISFGIPMEAVNAAKEIATKILEDERKDASNVKKPANFPHESALKSFFSSSTSSSGPFFAAKVDKTSFAEQLLPAGLSVKEKGNLFIVKIDLDAQPLEDEELFDKIQTLLRSRRGEKSDFCEESRVKKTKKGNIYQIGFVKQNTMQTLINELKGFFGPAEAAPAANASEATLGK